MTKHQEMCRLSRTNWNIKRKFVEIKVLRDERGHYTSDDAYALSTTIVGEYFRVKGVNGFEYCEYIGVDRLLCKKLGVECWHTT